MVYLSLIIILWHSIIKSQVNIANLVYVQLPLGWNGKNKLAGVFLVGIRGNVINAKFILRKTMLSY